MKIIAVLALPLTLSACWTGPQFYAANESVQAIPAGRYKVVHVEAPLDDDKATQIGDRLSVAYGPDGRIIVSDSSGPDEPSNGMLARLEGTDGLYVAQIDLGQGLTPVGMTVYGLVNVIPGGYQLALPLCDGTRRLSLKYGGVIKGALYPRKSCAFAERAKFEAAMREFSKDPIRWTEYRRVKQ